MNVGLRRPRAPRLRRAAALRTCKAQESEISKASRTNVVARSFWYVLEHRHGENMLLRGPEVDTTGGNEKECLI